MILPTLSKRHLIIIFVIIITLVIGLAVWLALRVAPVTNEVIDTSSTVGEGLPQSGNVAGEGIDTPSLGGVSLSDPSFGDQIIISDIKNKTKIFIERLASYSSDSDLSQMSDLYSQMTPELRGVIDAKRAVLLAKFAAGNGYEGYTTQVVTMEVVSSDLANGSINIKSKAARDISYNNEELKTSYFDYFLVWVRDEKNQWVVSEFKGEI